MDMSGTFLLLAAFAYLCGSIPFGKLVGKKHGIDIQKHGSGNIGFSNVRRVLGWKPGLMVLAGDVMKGFVPVFIASNYLSFDLLIVVAIIAILGHVFPLWLKFRGGKGIATGLGVTLALSAWLGAIGLLVYLLGMAVFKKSAPSSVAAAWSLPLLCTVFLPHYVLAYVGLAVFATWTHRSNFKKHWLEPRYD